MKIEEAILYVLAERNGGLRTEQIADIINRRKLHVRKDVIFSSNYDANSLFFRFMKLSLCKKNISYETDIYMATSDLGRVYMA